MKKAALLLRCSTNLQDYNRQRTDLLAITNRFGFETDESLIFGELVTGKDDKRKGDRKSIRQLLESCKNGLVDVILINEVSRLTRGFLYGVNFIDSFNRDYKIPIYFRDKKKWTIDIETGKINDQFEKELRKYFEQAEAELETIRIRFSSGKRDAAGLNQAIGARASFGYMRENKHNILNPETSIIVKELYSKYLEEGSTLLSTSRYLMAKYPKYSKTLKSVGTIRNILRNKANTGVLTYSIYDEVDEADYKYDVTQPAIIDNETYERALDKLANNRTITQYDRTKKHLLQKLLRCYDCGTFFTPSASLKRGTCYYRCGQKTAHIKDCSNSLSLNEITTDSIIWEFVKKELFSTSTLNQSQKEEAILEQQQKKDELLKDLEYYTTNLSKAKKRLDKMQDYLIREYITEEKYLQIKPEIDSEISSNEDSISSLKEKIEIIDLSIKRLSTTNFTEEYFAELEKDITKKIAFLKEYIKVIYPIKAGKYILYKVYDTLNSVYYIFHKSNRGNVKVKSTTAYYVNMCHAIFQNDKERLTVYESGDYFVIPNASLFVDTDELELFASFEEMAEYCELNNQIIYY